MGIEPATSSLGIKTTAPLFSQLTKPFKKINVHATHTVHAVPDLRVAGGRLGDDVLVLVEQSTLLIKRLDRWMR